MQSGNGIAEMEQQFMVDDCCSSFFPVSHNSMNHLQRQSRMFQHLHPHIPITHQLFQHQQQFQAFQQQRLHHRLALGHQSISGCDNSPSDSGVLGGAPFPFFAVNFKLGLNESSRDRDVLNDEDAVLREAAEHIPESRAAVAMSQCWQTQDPSAIKEPFWKPLDIEYVINRNHKRCEEEKVEGSSKTIEQVQERDQGEHYDNKYGLFGELEAIYSRENIQRGSGSALTGENLPTIAGLQGHFGEPHPELPTAVIDHGSETSIGEEASLRKLQKRRTERKRKQLSSITAFFENLIKQMMNHQEGLHRKFLEVIERRDQKRADLEEAWRRQEAAKFNSEAIARAREQALASSREDTIVSYLENITGQSISLPIRTQFDQFQPQIHGEGKPVEINDVVVNLGNPSTTSRRWPKAEVQALIRVRSSLESKFQEPGLKGTLWEEISSSMASVGYQRSAKRCKEKWENINKYFRKTKDSARKRSKHSKTCPYFHQLDHLYSTSLISGSSLTSSKPRRAADDHNVGVRRKDNSELLDTIIVQTDHGNEQNPSLGFVHEQIEMSEKFKMGSLKLDFSSNIEDSYATETGRGKHEQGREEGKGGHRDEEEDEDVDELGEEEEEEDEEEEEADEEEEDDNDDEGEEHQLDHA